MMVRGGSTSTINVLASTPTRRYERPIPNGSRAFPNLIFRVVGFSTASRCSPGGHCWTDLMCIAPVNCTYNTSIFVEKSSPNAFALVGELVRTRENFGMWSLAQPSSDAVEGTDEPKRRNPIKPSALLNTWRVIFEKANTPIFRRWNIRVFFKGISF